ncbi:PadR family transcriptional regulator [Streptomyces sp. TLI_105]|uniref:PadR family transcriptional regulator n=1 Tax=Streptomyces sp. TLI_105 TaxID=1881019 RepID=UPI000896D89B|nr:PadR family transcriptional regulator [Streptomyces sp. TLI_105]SEB83243.1 Transcriptional regulator PadR-like family protein [Streptomyces sp. TLI_105]
MQDVKLTPHTQTVLRALLGQGDDTGQRSVVLTEGLYGLELSRRTGLPNGTLFPILERLRQAGWVERYWERDETAEAEGRPRRRFYRISSKGAATAPQALAEARTRAPAMPLPGTARPGLAGGTGE